MVTRRSAKTKGNQFEYSVKDSLEVIYKDILLTKELGFVRQYDLISKSHDIAIECKFHKTMSWNAAKKLFFKLEEKARVFKRHYLIFKTNRQPVLVMYRDKTGLILMEFETFFGVPFVTHSKKEVKNE